MAAAQQRYESVPQLSVLEGVRYLDWRNPHAKQRIRERPGLTFAYVEDVILTPYGRIYWHEQTDRFVLHDPATDTPTGKSRTVITEVLGQTAVPITAYNVDDPAMYAEGSQFRLRGVRLEQ